VERWSFSSSLGTIPILPSNSGENVVGTDSALCLSVPTDMRCSFTSRFASGAVIGNIFVIVLRNRIRWDLNRNTITSGGITRDRFNRLTPDTNGDLLWRCFRVKCLIDFIAKDQVAI